MGQYSYTGSAQFVTVATTGEYDIVAFGAQGGGGNTGGLGAEVGGDLELYAGEKLEIIVGGAGLADGGGGGGSFVLANIGSGGTYKPLIVAGGGGGAGKQNGASGATTPGDGTGGSGGGNFGGGGGSGVKSDGGNATAPMGAIAASGGSNRSRAYAGGTSFGGSASGDGGFGGGGGAGANYGGGGGGYSGGVGGGSGGVGGGGGSYDGGVPISDQTAAGENSNNGRVVIFPNVVCFASATLVRTSLGDRAVEDLVVGDVVVTATGAHRLIRWVGHRTIDCRRHPQPAEVLPVRIAADAFGPGKPARDLCVSPGHAICVDMMGGMLIPAGSLVNGTTIRQVEVESVTYWHVELDEHEIILAEGLPTESYLEMGNRTFFAENSTVALSASPDTDDRTHDDFCRPFHACGPLVEAVRVRLAARARELAFGQTRERAGERLMASPEATTVTLTA